MTVAVVLLTGQAITGAGRHAETQALDPRAFEIALGYAPFPGSLNVRLDKPVIPITWGPHTHVNARWRFRAWEAKITGLDAPVHVLVWRRPTKPQTVVELVSPVRLRDVLDADGRVELEVNA